MKVRVTKEGFMFGVMQKVGTEEEPNILTLEKDEHFSKNWMEEIKEKPKAEKKESKPKSKKSDD